MSHKKELQPKNKIKLKNNQVM
uniref:Uncharacterized protein n=1 Tax=Anguilla anguilla TaxID=7936 RepID=A0A0E9PD97_ANGAN